MSNETINNHESQLLLQLFVKEHEKQIKNLSDICGIKPEIFAITNSDDVYCYDINAEKLSSGNIKAKKVYEYDKGYLYNSTPEELAEEPSLKIRKFAYPHIKWTVAKNNFPKNILDLLLKNEVIKEDKRNHDLVYFSDNIRDKNQFIKCLNQIGVSETTEILAVWQQPLEEHVCSKDLPMENATGHLIYLRKHPVGYVKTDSNTEKDRLGIFSHRLIELMWNHPNEGEYKKYIEKTKKLLRFIETPSEKTFELEAARKNFTEAICLQECPPCSYPDNSKCNQFSFCIGFYDKDRDSYCYGEFEGTKQEGKDYCSLFHDRYRGEKPHCLVFQEKETRQNFIDNLKKLKLSSLENDQNMSWVFPTFYKVADEFEPTGFIHFVTCNKNLFNGVQLYHIQEMFFIIREALILYIHELYLKQRHNRIYQHLKIIGLLNQSLLNEKSKYVICYNTLSALTASDGLGISRAILFLKDQENVLPDVVMAIGSENEKIHKIKVKEFKGVVFKTCRDEYKKRGIAPDCVFSDRIMKYIYLNKQKFESVFKTIWDLKWPYNADDFPHNFAFFYKDSVVKCIEQKDKLKNESKFDESNFSTTKTTFKDFLDYLFENLDSYPSLNHNLYVETELKKDDIKLYDRDKYRTRYLEEDKLTTEDEKEKFKAFHLEFGLDKDEGLLFPIFDSSNERKCMGLLWVDRKHAHNRPIIEEERSMIVNMIAHIVNTVKIKDNIAQLEHKINDFHAKLEG